MSLSDLYQHVGSWMDCSGPLADIVISSRIRLARNVAGFRFWGHSDSDQRLEVLNFLRDRILATSLREDLYYVSMEDIGGLERQVLQERQLISRQHAQGEGARGVAISRDESLTLMLNEEDHLRMQILASGLQLTELYERINRVDDLLESNISYAFSPELGYLTACPTNVGTGIRVSVMLHLPALKMTGRLNKFFRAAKDMNLAVRGLFGEGTDPAGDMYQLSNQVTLGRSEDQIIHDLMENAVVPTVQYERQARQFLQRHRSTALDDKIFRAVGVLRHARMISSDECKYLLSLLRLGIHLERITDISLGVINELFILTQPGHLQHMRGAALEPQQRDIARAELVRQYLG